jgi:hypothetical protein
MITNQFLLKNEKSRENHRHTTIFWQTVTTLLYLENFLMYRNIYIYIQDSKTHKNIYNIFMKVAYRNYMIIILIKSNIKHLIK